MRKIVDNTAISALCKEIPSVDLFPAVCGRYDIIIPNDVAEECMQHPRIAGLRDLAEIYADKDDTLTSACRYLKQRYLWLGSGETSAIATSMILTADGLENYLVTDDGAARNILNKVHEDQKLREIIGKPLERINFTGTVGLINRLKESGVISKDMCCIIADDLQRSTFRISPGILDILRN